MKRIGVSLAIVAMVGALIGASASRADAQYRRVDLRFQGGVNLGVPVFLDIDRSVVKPGASITGWGGFDIGWFVADFALGLMFSPIFTDNIPEAMGIGIGREPLVRWHFSPGVRFQVPTLESVLPYVAARFDANLWQLAALGTNCGWYYCRGEGRFRFAPGFTGKTGVGIRLKGPWFLDVGLKYSLTGKGQFFVRSQWWLEPFIGFLFRGDRDRLDGVGY